MAHIVDVKAGPEGPESGGVDERTERLLRRLIRRDASSALRKIIERWRPEDLAAAIELMPRWERRRLFGVIDDRDVAAQVLANLGEESSREVAGGLGGEHLLEVLECMEPDDAADIVEVLPEELRQSVLRDWSGSEHGHVRELLAWPSDSAGGIMSPQVFKLDGSVSCRDVIRTLQQQHEELETIYYIYVVGDGDELLGVASLRSLLTAHPDAPLSSVMTADLITVSPRVDQEEVARIVARYDLLAVPVVDNKRRILGVVTVDDVIDVIREEAAEDMMLMAGVVDDQQGSVLRQSRARAGWLIATLLGGILMSEIISSYESTLKAVVVLAGFIPVIMGMGGNVGIQSATVAVRGLATGRVQVGGRLRFVWQEARIGLLVGVFFAVLLGGYLGIRYFSSPMIGISVASSIFLAIGSASVLGSVIPIGFARLGVDPAIATGPFVTTLVDLIGIVIYFNVARLLLGL